MLLATQASNRLALFYQADSVMAFARAACCLAVYCVTVPFDFTLLFLATPTAPSSTARSAAILRDS